MREEVSIETLRDLLVYDPMCGLLFWKERPVAYFNETQKRSRKHACSQWNSRWAGKEAFTISHCEYGYREGKIFRKTFKAHRVSWAIYYGYWPNDTIDHINGDTADNRIENLRDVPIAENARNKGLYRSNKSGVHGVSWYKPYNKWVSHIPINGKRKHLGYFTSLEDAINARKYAECSANIFHKNHGRIAV